MRYKKTRGTKRLDYVRHCMGNKTDALSVVQEDENGLQVTSAFAYQRGTHLLSCRATAMALEPSRRHCNCAYCSQAIVKDAIVVCSGCGITAVCHDSKTSCRLLHKWHETSGECRLLQALVQVVGKANLDSSLLLSMKLLFRQWHDSKNPEGRNNDCTTRIDWNLFDCLYAAPLEQATSDDSIHTLLSNVQLALNNNNNNNNNNSSVISTDWLTRGAFDHVLARVVGCSHAVTDVMLPLGEQCLGRALFMEHSFYNHACVPNAFLSCTTATDATLTARVHLLRNVSKEEPITLSYLPLSGLCKSERQSRLQEGYSFVCNCTTCCNEDHEQYLKVNDNNDVESLRLAQFECHSTLLGLEEQATGGITFDKNALDACMGMLRMLQRGVENQNVPASHEVRLEMHRLLARAYTLNGQAQEALGEHEAFFNCLSHISGLFDPVAEATQRLEYAKLLENEEDKRKQRTLAKQIATIALGSNHEFVNSIAMVPDTIRSRNNDIEPSLKKPRRNES